MFVAGRSTAATPGATFEPLTFRRGSVSYAKFAPDGRTIVYAANWEGGPLEIYSTQPGSPESRPLGIKADLQGVSSKGEMAVLLERPGKGAVLARVPIGGGAPREVLENVALGRLGTRRRIPGRRAHRRAGHDRVPDRPRALPGARVAERHRRVRRRATAWPSPSTPS